MQVFSAFNQVDKIQSRMTSILAALMTKSHCKLKNAKIHHMLKVKIHSKIPKRTISLPPNPLAAKRIRKIRQRKMKIYESSRICYINIALFRFKREIKSTRQEEPKRI
jgi:hypothetical protein